MKVLITSLVILAVVGTGLALKCFICNSQVDSACNDHLQDDSPALYAAFVSECAPEGNETEPFCRKVKEVIEGKNGSITRVHRECGYKRRAGYDCYQKRAENYVMNVCQCDTEVCNDSPALTAPIASLLAVAFPLLARFM